MICHQENTKRKEKNLDAILHISLTPYMHYMLHNYSIVTCRTFVIKQRWRRSGIKMIKVAEGKKWQQQDIEYMLKKIPLVASSHHFSNDFYQFFNIVVCVKFKKIHFFIDKSMAISCAFLCSSTQHLCHWTIHNVYYNNSFRRLLIFHFIKKSPR